MQRLLTISALVAVVGANVLSLGCNHTFIFRQERPTVAASEPTRALLILPGLRQSARGRRNMRRFYPETDFDVFIPDYYSKEGLEPSRENLARFIEENRLAEYDELYVFTYLLGAWVFNTYLEGQAENPLPNIRRIIYDRSPIQEQVAGLVMINMPWIITTFYGSTVQEFHDTPYSSIEHGEREIGIIIECRATPYARRHRDQLDPVVGDEWLPEAMNQPHDDAIYVYRHHDEMYYSFDHVGDDILSFFRSGHFTEDARRVPCQRTPFD